ncbi:oligopeptide ABC transporter substrate-binding protein [Facklamia miroungae]|uniref:Peptide/nickel transport system substrate-binding protein n=1 Tax=Facklamia miroungae TaxID=120956 RepID=A0A1G7PPL4_9LACT|nr:oligopeptide ABC transporter substrate-binding protein [Facklamia miroungae]NKZ28783.1 oligopeptide ABC transporter substrate-binding protein [Facklamia miroungae]SDF88208.1 peptide/nickel transport system substrate-binding protein [Facklamia miroungae]
MRKSLEKNLIQFMTTMTISSLVLSTAPMVHAEETDGEGAPSIDIPTSVEHEGEVMEGGTLKIAYVSDTAFAGVFNNMFYTGQPDAVVIEKFNPGLYGFDNNFKIDDSGFAKVEMDIENKQVTITIPEGVKWDDGEPITIDDVIFPYYVVGHPDYTGIRYGSDFENVVGMAEYHSGEAEEISGLERVDDYTLKVTYLSFPNSMVQAGGGISSYIEPEHVFEGIEVADMEDSAPVREKPVGFGPFKVDSMTPGEAVTYTANENYYKGRPNLDGMTINVINPNSIIAEMKAGNFDIASLPTDKYDTFKDATNFTNIGYEMNVYTYIGFKMGKWNEEEEKNEFNPDLVTSNKALRQAMAYAMDNNSVGSEFYQGLRRAADSMITPNFVEYLNPDVKAYEYNPEKAKEILAEAGFKDVDGDGLVEDPNGEKFTLNFASMSGGETAAPLAQYYVQAWNAVGIPVQLLDGQLLEFNSFYERIKKDDPEIHVFQAAFGTGGDPNPNSAFGERAQFNYSRYVSEENSKLLADIESDESFDDAYRQKAFYAWQEFMHEEVPVIPTLWRYELTAVNKRVSNWDVEIGADLDWSKVGVTAESPIAE